jgi:hypothetical protein
MDTSILNRLLEILGAPVPKDIISCGYYQDRMSLAQKLVTYPPGIIAIVFCFALAWGLPLTLVARREVRCRHSYLPELVCGNRIVRCSAV